MFTEAQAGRVEKSHVLSSLKGGAGPHFQPLSPHTGPAPSGSREHAQPLLKEFSARPHQAVSPRGQSRPLAQGRPPQGTPYQPPAGFSAQRRD